MVRPSTHDKVVDLETKLEKIDSIIRNLVATMETTLNNPKEDPQQESLIEAVNGMNSNIAVMARSQLDFQAFMMKKTETKNDALNMDSLVKVAQFVQNDQIKDMFSSMFGAKTEIPWVDIVRQVMGGLKEILLEAKKEGASKSNPDIIDSVDYEEEPIETTAKTVE